MSAEATVEHSIVLAAAYPAGRPLVVKEVISYFSVGTTAGHAKDAGISCKRYTIESTPSSFS